MNKTARFVLKTVAAGLAFCAFVCLVVGSWSDVYEAIERRRACRLSKQESRFKNVVFPEFVPPLINRL